MKTPIYLTMILLLGMISCEENDDDISSVPLDKEFEVRWDREYIIDSDLSFALNETKDSRCPKGVVCIWAGEATVWLKMLQPENLTTDDQSTIKLKNTEPKTQRYKQYKFELIDVFPYPDIEKDYSKKDIRVVLKVTQTDMRKSIN